MVADRQQEHTQSFGNVFFSGRRSKFLGSICSCGRVCFLHGRKKAFFLLDSCLDLALGFFCHEFLRKKKRKKRGLMRLSRGAIVLWEKFESGEEADTEIQQQRNHAVIIFQEVSYRQGAVNIGEKQESGRGDAG